MRCALFLLVLCAGFIAAQDALATPVPTKTDSDTPTTPPPTPSKTPVTTPATPSPTPTTTTAKPTPSPTTTTTSPSTPTPLPTPSTSVQTPVPPTSSPKPDTTTTTSKPSTSTSKPTTTSTDDIIDDTPEPTLRTTPTPTVTSDGDNTTTYIAIGGGALFVAGLVACIVVMLRRRQAADDLESHGHISPREYYSEQSRNTGLSQKSQRQTTSHTPTTLRNSMDIPNSRSGPGAGKNRRTNTGQNTQGSSAGRSYGPSSVDPGEVNELAGYDIRFDKSMSNFRVANDEIEVGELIASGGFGVIYRGHFGGEDIAIKKCLPDKVNNLDAMESFMMEIKLMSKLDHPNIVRFVGVAWTTLVQLKMLTEYMPRGNVRMLLQDVKKQKTPFNLQWHKTSNSPVTKLRIAANVAEALVYLHSNDPAIIHRDLKSSNVLLSTHYEAKLTDFGTSRELSDENTMTAEIGTLAWIAPEIMLGGHYTERADIYSFGVLLNELDLCDLPYSNVTDSKGGAISHTRLGVLVAQGAVTPRFTSQCPPWIAQMGLECLRFDPSQRPTAMQLAYRLRRMIADTK